MKKILAIAIVVMMVPFTAFGMNAISDEDLDSITGQAGMDIYFDGTLTVDLTVNDVAWGDDDGVALSGSGAGYVVINGSGATQTDIDVGLDISGKMSIDMGTTPSGGLPLTGSSIGGTVSYMAMTLPTIDVDVTMPDNLTIALATDTEGLNQKSLGILNLGVLSVTVSVGSLTGMYICAH